MKSPKVLVGCPTHKSYAPVVDRYLKAVKDMDYDNGGLMLVDNSEDDIFFNELKKKGAPVIKGPYSKDTRQRIVDSRNLLREFMLKNDFDYLLSLEQDVMASPELLKELLAHQKDIVGAYYDRAKNLTLRDSDGNTKSAVMNIPYIYLESNGILRQGTAPELHKKGLQKVGAAGLGCMLISRKALEAAEFKVSEGKKAVDDVPFCSDMKEAGFEIFVDTNIHVKHLKNVLDHLRQKQQ